MKKVKTLQSEILLKQELEYQQKTINLIASENYTPNRMNSTAAINNKYTEGYGEKRYYQGCTITNRLEQLAIEEFAGVFNCRYVNVQPHSGAQANLAVMLSVLEMGDTILTLNLPHGGHLTHGFKSNFSGKFYKVVHYNLKFYSETQEWNLDFEEIEYMMQTHSPKLIVCGFSAFMFEIDFEKIGILAKRYNCLMLADIAHISGFIAAKQLMSPFPHADIVTTTTHKTIRGHKGGMIMTNDEELMKKINKTVFPGLQGGAYCGGIAAKLMCAELINCCEDQCFVQYIKQTNKNANIMLNLLKQSIHINVVSPVTTNHMILFECNTPAPVFEQHGIILNANFIPYQNEAGFKNGLRVGLQAVTTRRFTEHDIVSISNAMIRICDNYSNNITYDETLHNEMLNITKQYSTLDVKVCNNMDA